MITSILDNDLYKFSTSYAYMKLFPQAEGTFKFCDRNKTIYSIDMVEIIRQRIGHLQSLKLSVQEKDFMCKSCYYIPSYYFKWLASFRYDMSKINITHLSDGTLDITVTGLLHEITLWEVPILAIVSKVITEFQGPIDFNTFIRTTKDKAKLAEESGIKLSEFGTRRRASLYIQDLAVKILTEYCPNSLTGTSNCYLAMKHGLTPIGTHPHEWFMFHGAMYGYEQANYLALENWINVYDGDLGIALADTYTSDMFFRNFSKKQAKLCDGVRQDSGDPFAFIPKAIKRYKEHRINPLHKTIIFSDALTIPIAIEIAENCKGRIGCAFGIGTDLTNDCGKKPANIIMKLIQCRMNSKQIYKDCIKLSDVEGKNMGNPNEIALAQLIINRYVA